MRGGYSLVELLIVLGILVLIGTLVFLGFDGFFGTSGLHQATEGVLSLMEQARGKTISREGGFAYGVHFDSNKATLFRAPTYIDGNVFNTVYDLNPGFHIAATTLNGGGTDVIFQIITGETLSDGTVAIEKVGDPSVKKVIKINATGIVEVE